MVIVASIFYGCGLQKNSINNEVNAFYLKSLKA